MISAQYSTSQTTMITVIFFLLLSTSWGLRFTNKRDNTIIEEGEEDVVEDPGDPGVGDAIVGFYDVITNLTKDVASLVDEVEGGFVDLKGDKEDNLEEEEEVVEDEQEDTVNNSTTTTGGSLVSGLFNTLHSLTKDVGTLVGAAEKIFHGSRENVLKLADSVDDGLVDLSKKVQNFAGSLEEGRYNFSLVLRNVTITNSSQTSDDPTVIPQSLLANSSGFIVIGETEEKDKEEIYLVE